MTDQATPDETTPAEELASPAVAHPGFDWVSRADCGSTSDAPYFVEAGRVIEADVLSDCKACPVRRECVTHSYLGGPNGTMIGAGYYGGFSLGQRKSMSLEAALAQVDADSSPTTL